MQRCCQRKVEVLVGQKDGVLALHGSVVLRGFEVEREEQEEWKTIAQLGLLLVSGMLKRCDTMAKR